MRKKTIICLLSVCLSATLLLLGGCGKSNSSGGFNVIVLGAQGQGKSEVTSSIASAYGKKISVDQLDNAKECKSGSVIYRAESVSIKSDSRNYNIFDLPEHRDVCKSIASQGIVPDGAIVVTDVSGRMPAMVEQVGIIKDLGIRNVVVYITNCTDSDLVELLETDLKDYDFENMHIDFIEDYDNYSIENAKKTVSIMDKWTAENNVTNSVSGTAVSAYMYVLTEDEGGNYASIFPTDELEITVNNKTYKGTIATPDVDMMMPGDPGKTVFELDGTASAKTGDKVTVKKDGKDVMVGVVFG